MGAAWGAPNSRPLGTSTAPDRPLEPPLEGALECGATWSLGHSWQSSGMGQRRFGYVPLSQQC